MVDNEIHDTRKESTAEYTLVYLFASVLVIEILGLIVVHSFVLFETGGPSTYNTVQAVWIAGIVLIGILLVVELLT